MFMWNKQMDKGDKMNGKLTCDLEFTNLFIWYRQLTRGWMDELANECMTEALRIEESWFHGNTLNHLWYTGYVL